MTYMTASLPAQGSMNKPCQPNRLAKLSLQVMCLRLSTHLTGFGEGLCKMLKLHGICEKGSDTMYVFTAVDSRAACGLHTAAQLRKATGPSSSVINRAWNWTLKAQHHALLID
jgi:hypothetical protein